MDYFQQGSLADLWSVFKKRVLARNLSRRKRKEPQPILHQLPKANPSSKHSKSQLEYHHGPKLNLQNPKPNPSLTCREEPTQHHQPPRILPHPNPHNDNKNRSEESKSNSSAEVRQKFRDLLIEHYPSLPNAELKYHLEAAEDMRLFLMLFPRDHTFDKDTLIQLWLAKGFIKGENKNRVANLFFQALVLISHILLIGTCFATKKDKYELNVDKLNNDLVSLMRDKVAESVNSHEASNGDQHVALVGDDIDEISLKALKDFKKLKALLLLCENASNINKIPHQVFFGLRFLEVLHLSGSHITELPCSIENLTELKYLDLSYSLIEVLPESIKSLSKLQTLKLNYCERLLRLPEATRKLISLENLELDVLNQLAIMPKGMGALTKLETLSAFLVHNDDGRSIKELKSMNNLKGRFCISRLENVSNSQEVKEAALSKKKHLEELELRWSDSYEARENDDKILELLQPSSNLKYLKISCYGGKTFPRWISLPSLEKLTTIILFKCDNTEILPFLGQLPSLKFLSLMEMNSVKQIGSEFWGLDDIPIAFPKLEKLEIIGLSQLETWNETTKGGYPQLCKLVIELCPKLVAIPSLLLQRNTIKHLEILQCTDLKSLLENNLSTSLVTLIVDECPLITEEFQKHESKGLQKIKHVENVWLDEEEIITV